MEFRKCRVLQAIIDDYVSTAEPVGSRTIARKYQLGVSPATIRNEMADLEELGYLEQPHTSAGRVPSDKGYRYFVDHLMATLEMEPERRRQIHGALSEKAHEAATLMQQAARLLAEVTGCAVLVSGPEVARSICQHAQLLPLREDRAILILVTEGGFMHSKILEFDRPVDPGELRELSRAIHEHFQGQPLGEIARGMLSGLDQEMAAVRRVLARAIEVLREELATHNGEKIVLGGATNLLRQPEFRDVEKASALLSALEEEQLAQILLHRWVAEQESVAVAIGEELESRVIQDCSLVAAGYRLGPRLVGRIGVLGPRRMDYARITTLVDGVTREISLILTESSR